MDRKEDIFRIQNKVICITGGSGGIGSGIAEGLAALGARVVILGRSSDKLASVKQGILEQTGVEVRTFAADITDEVSVEAVFESVYREYGSLYGLVNSAGTSYVSPLSEMPLECWQQVMDVNVKGTMLCCKAAGKYMYKSGGGRIVNISSLAATHGKPGYTAYTSSKAAVNAFTFTLAAEWARMGINVNAVSPALIVTDINRKQVESDPAYLNRVLSTIPNGRLCSAGELLGTIVFLLSPASAYLTGQIIGCDGGAQNGDISVISQPETM